MTGQTREALAEARLNEFLSQFDLDDQERILRYALDHIVPRMKSLATAAQAQSEAQSEPQWYPMSDAARVFGRFLAVVDGQIRIVCWGKASHVAMYGWILVDQGPEDAELCHPTHYRPMPNLPGA